MSYTLTGTPGTASLSVTLTDDDSVHGTAALTTAPQTFAITVTASEIAVSGKGINIANGSSTPSENDDTSFGVVPAASGSAVRTFTLHNSGDAALTLETITRGGSHPDDFAISLAPASSVGASTSTTFHVTFDPAGLGLRQAIISIPNNDSDENPFTFAVSGIGGAPEIAIANGADEFTSGSSTLRLTGAWPGSNTTKTLTVKNTGSTPLSGLAVTFTGDAAADFSFARRRNHRGPRPVR